jgi:hypothetical protein
LAFILILAKLPSSAQVIATFKSYGHDDESINGMSGSTAFFFKIDPLVDINGSKLVIYFEASRALVVQNSFINIIVGDRPLYSGRLTKDSIQRISIDLAREYASNDGKYLKVQIKTLLNISDDKCRDLDNPAMWLKIKGYSYLSLNRSTKNFFNNINIANCFDSKRAIVYPANPSLHDLKAVAWAYARMKKTDIKNIQVFEADKVPDTVRNYIMVGNMDKLPGEMRNLIKVTPQKGEGLFYLSKRVLNVTDSVIQMVDKGGHLLPVRTVQNLTVPGEVLFITGGDDAGFEKTITALGNINILNSTFGDYLVIDQAENTFFKTVDENRSRLTFKQIGGVTNFMSGIGSLKSEYNFKNSDFSFTPKEVEISIVANYSALNANDRGFFNIYLNGSLINTEKLDQSGKLKTTVTINRYQHHKYNTLVAEFRFYPSSGNCNNSFTNFFAEIDVDKSYLESKNPFITSDLSFYQYPEAFNSGSTWIVVSKEYAKYAAAAMGEVVYELNNNINSNNFPTFKYADEVSTGDIKKYNLIALLDRNDKLMKEFPDAPIKFDQKFRLYNNDNNQIVYSLNDSVSNGLAQIFYGRANNATLVLTGTGTHLADAFTSVAKSITEQLSTLSSNVCISDVSGNKYLFNISKSSDNLEYVDTKSALSRFWDSYNLYILLGILILILLSFLYVRSRVQKSQESEDEF